MTQTVTFEDLLRFTQQCLQSVGTSSANAHEAGLPLVTTDAMGLRNTGHMGAPRFRRQASSSSVFAD